MYDSAGQPVVTYASNQRVFHKSTAPEFVVREDAVGFIDLVIMGWIIEQRDIRRRRRRMGQIVF